MVVPRNPVRVAELVGVAIVGGALALGGAALFGKLGSHTTIKQVSPLAQGGFNNASLQPAVVKGLTPEQIYRRDAPGVVQITSIDGPGEQSLGSGFVIDSRGDIVTNDHVVQGATDIRVSFSGSAAYPAEIVGSDPSSDLAVLRVAAPSSALHPLGFGDSSAVEVGDTVFAIGNPFGLERTMTAGIVSALGRDINAPNGMTIPNAIQTDAPINHGNSGGPLLDSFGRVIAVNSQIEGGTVDANVGIGFAIPSATARSVVDRLISGHA
jgi:putative serine protease PepD